MAVINPSDETNEEEGHFGLGYKQSFLISARKKGEGICLSLWKMKNRAKRIQVTLAINLFVLSKLRYIL